MLAKFMKRAVVLPALLPILLLGATSCSGLGARIEGGYAIFEMDGDLALAPTAGGVSLDTIRTDVQTDLGLDDQIGTPYARADLALGIARVSASGFMHDQDGSGTLTVQFGDIPASTSVNTEIEMMAAKASVIFDLLNVGVVRIGPGVGASFFDIDMSVASGILTEEINVVAPVPMVFVQAEVDLGPLDAMVEVGGMYADIEDAAGTFLDIEATVRYQIMDAIHIFGGARYIQLKGEGDIEGQDFEVDLKMQGVMLGIGFDV
jgi:hypothetical protein